MHHVVACIFCGGIDPTNDQLLLQAAIAGVITTPWVLRARLAAAFDRIRGKRRDAAYPTVCPMPDADDREPPTSTR